jgi:hypothetical protein
LDEARARWRDSGRFRRRDEQNAAEDQHPGCPGEEMHGISQFGLAEPRRGLKNAT